MFGSEFESSWWICFDLLKIHFEIDLFSQFSMRFKLCSKHIADQRKYSVICVFFMAFLCTNYEAQHSSMLFIRAGSVELELDYGNIERERREKKETKKKNIKSWSVRYVCAYCEKRKVKKWTKQSKLTEPKTMLTESAK